MYTWLDAIASSSCCCSCWLSHAEGLSVFDTIAKLDLTNALQVQLLHAYFSHNQAAVDFFLAHCVLPTESRQYPYRLTGTSWNLADNAARAVVGFSGTNDHHRLLPLQVHQADHADVQLQGTNGKMLNLLLREASYSTLHRAAVAGQDDAAHVSAAGLWHKPISYCMPFCLFFGLIRHAHCLFRFCCAVLLIARLHAWPVLCICQQHCLCIRQLSSSGPCRVANYVLLLP